MTRIFTYLFIFVLLCSCNRESDIVVSDELFESRIDSVYIFSVDTIYDVSKDTIYNIERDTIVIFDSILNYFVDTIFDTTTIILIDTLFVENKSKKIRYNVENDKILISTIKDSIELVIQLSNSVGNELFDFRKFGKIRENEYLVDSNVIYFHSNNSDWFGPFQVKAVENKNGDDVGEGLGFDDDGFRITFTGGAHLYNNKTIGSSKTARLSNVSFNIDGRNVKSGFGYANNIEIKWTNYIQGYNTKKEDGSGREILQENISLKYDGFEWEAETEIIPLEDIVIVLWYGYQMTGIMSGMSSHWKYVNGLNRDIDQPTSGNNEAVAMIAFGGACDVEMWIYNEIDLGKREYCRSNSTNSAFKSGYKGYFTIINDGSGSKVLNALNSYYLFGKYKFNLN